MGAVAGSIETLAVVLLVVVNAAYVGVLLTNRSPRFVDRWTRPLLVADGVLIVGALGLPVVAFLLRLGARGVSVALTAATQAFSGK